MDWYAKLRIPMKESMKKTGRCYFVYVNTKRAQGVWQANYAFVKKRAHQNLQGRGHRSVLGGS